MNRAVVGGGHEAKRGALGPDKEDLSTFTDGEEKADRERLKIRERERYEKGRG